MDAKKRLSHVAIYGNTRLLRGYCYECKRFAFVLDGKLQCCGKKSSESPTHARRMSQPEQRRRKPGHREREAILRGQDYRCLYCDRRFGDWVKRDEKFVRLRIHWDHLDPYCRGMDNRASNFVAACNVCNLLKSGKIFSSVEAVREYVAPIWEAKGYTDLS